MHESHDITIVVSNYNASDIIGEALQSIIDTAGDVRFDVLVIDDASTDGGFGAVRTRFEKDERFSFVENKKNVGVSTLNIVLERTEARYVMTLDTDARLHPGSLQAMISFMDKTPGAGAATAKLLNRDGSVQNYYRRLMTPVYCFFTTPIGRIFDKYVFGLRYFNRYHYSDLDVTRVFEIEQPPVACLIMRRSALGEYIMSPAYHLYFIDVDFCRRMYARGYKIFLVPDAPVTHLKSAAASKRPSAWTRRQYYSSLLTYFKRNYTLWYPLIWIIVLLDRVTRALMFSVVGREPVR